MVDRQTRNISLPPQQDAFVDALVASGRYRTASEVLRDGLRLLEAAEHRRLVEEWLCNGLREEDEGNLPPHVLERAKAHWKVLVDAALDDVAEGRVVDGPSAMQRIKQQIEGRRD